MNQPVSDAAQPVRGLSAKESASQKPSQAGKSTKTNAAHLNLALRKPASKRLRKAGRKTYKQTHRQAIRQAGRQTDSHSLPQRKSKVEATDRHTDGGLFLKCEECGRLFDNLFPACAFFFLRGN